MSPRGYGNERANVGDLAPANNLAAITPHDTNELAFWTRAIYVGVAGDVALIASHDSVAVTLVGVPAGSVIPVAAKIVKATGTTATSLVALY